MWCASTPSSKRVRALRRAVSLGLALALACTSAGAQESAQDPFAGRPAFSEAEQPALVYARCDEIRRMSAGMPEPEDRIDLSLTGELTFVRTDGALWYLFMCSDVRVMCVTYESNDMKPGDRVIMKGGYSRRDANHVMLDPCLANRTDAGP
jgi:hypothetical protein